MPRLRLARSETYLVVRVLREREQAAVAWEATAKRTTPKFFRSSFGQRTLELAGLDLENEGGLHDPMVYDRTLIDTCDFVGEALAKIGAALRALRDPDMGRVLPVRSGIQ